MAKRKRRLSKKGKRFFSVIGVIFVAIVASIICLNLDVNKEKTNTKGNDTIKKEEPKVEEKLKILDLESNTRPYAVMINNIKTVWGYQSGIQDAYMVYEIIVEGGYTRLMALYKDKSLDRIGSVRSSRHYFLDYALENDAIYVHFGWSPQAQSDIKKHGVNNINFMSYNGYTRDRSLGLASEHTAFTTTTDIMEGANYYGYRTTTDEKPLLKYSVKSVNTSNMDGAVPANKVYIEFSASRSTSFEYDSINKVYNRFQNNVIHKDYITGLQYTAKNIITYQVENYTISGDTKGRQTIENIGNGTGWYISEGYAVPITWEKSSRNSKTIYKYKDGTEIKVNDGNTYIEIQPTEKNLTIE
ncbi:MAG: DUF3048 domain-containing protein [Firmicutes bacterium]|nr:DUF3048 domain-containing protein [Bacillota bacterium]